MDEATDKDIWEYAQQHDYAIVTLDADFHVIQSAFEWATADHLAQVWQSAEKRNTGEIIEEPGSD